MTGATPQLPICLIGMHNKFTFCPWWIFYLILYLTCTVDKTLLHEPWDNFPIFHTPVCFCVQHVTFWTTDFRMPHNTPTLEALLVGILLLKVFNDHVWIDQVNVPPLLLRVLTTSERTIHIHFLLPSTKCRQWSDVQYWCERPVCCLLCQFFSSLWGSLLYKRQVIVSVEWWHLIVGCHRTDMIVGL